MRLHPIVCLPCGTALRAFKAGRACPDCGEIYPSPDRETRARVEANLPTWARGRANAAVIDALPPTVWSQLDLFTGDPL